MKYRRLGKTELVVSVVGIGAWQFGGEWGLDYTAAEVDAIIRRGKERGINLIDTAECYGDHLSETLIGQSIQGERDQWIVATKFGHKFHDHLDRTEHWTADEVRQQLEDSLRALRTDYVDLYQFHSGSDEVFDNDELWAMLAEQVQAGKVRALGISIGSNRNIHQTSRSTEVGSGAIQVIYNRIDRAPEDEVLPSCMEQDLGVLARVPLASGYLSGKYKPGDTFDDPKDVRSHRDKEGVQAKLREVQQIQATEVPAGVDMAAWALAWCLQHPAVTCVIPGCKTAAQVDSNASAVEMDMVRDDHPQAVQR
ncbi:MAG: aldo/keto reductase [Anaerolineae bacterium]|nr:aldo/keto reductase [Anaerolineae bacterium]